MGILKIIKEFFQIIKQESKEIIYERKIETWKISPNSSISMMHVTEYKVLQKRRRRIERK